MKKFEILDQVPKCDAETQSKKMLLGRWPRETCSVQGCPRPQLVQNAVSAKCSQRRRASKLLSYPSSASAVRGFIYGSVFLLLLRLAPAGHSHSLTRTSLLPVTDMLSKEPPWCDGSNCYECTAKFGVTTRKHHW